MPLITIVMPYYENAQMLPIHLGSWQHLPEDFSFVLVDDGSPEFPALDNLPAELAERLGARLALYRVQVDIPWNQHGARNLGAQQTETRWLFMTDMDHVVAPETAQRMLALPLDEEAGRTAVYKFPRRTPTGKTKEASFNTFLCTREAFYETGGYDEDYSGTYGGDGPMVLKLEKLRRLTIPEDVVLDFYSREQTPQAATTRYDREHYRALCLQRKTDKWARKDTIPRNPIRFPWVRVR